MFDGRLNDYIISFMWRLHPEIDRKEARRSARVFKEILMIQIDRQIRKYDAYRQQNPSGPLPDFDVKNSE